MIVSEIPLQKLLSVPDHCEGEVFETLLALPGVRIERIVSRGEVSPEGFWYDQEHTEWVVVLAGATRLMIEGEVAARSLGPGDAITLRPHVRHRVDWTDPERETVWLAVHIGEAT